MGRDNAIHAVIVVNDPQYIFSHRLDLIKSLIKCGIKVTVIAPVNRVQRRSIFNIGARCIGWDLNRGSRSLWGEMVSVFQLIGIYHKIRPTLVYHLDFKPIVYGSLAAKLLFVKRILNMVNGLGYALTEAPGESRTASARISLFFHWISHMGRNVSVIFQNQDDFSLFHSKRIIRRSSGIIINGSGVNVRWFNPAQVLQVDPVVVFPARMLYDKGIRELLQAKKILIQRGVKFELLLAGGVDTMNPAGADEATVRGWEKIDGVKWLGHVVSMEALLRKSRIACLPSYREGLPKALLEAASCGLPIVTTNAPGCAEVVVDNENGFKVKVGSISDLADALQVLLENYDLCQRYGRASRVLVLNRFSSKIIVSKHISAICNLLRRPV